MGSNKKTSELFSGVLVPPKGTGVTQTRTGFKTRIKGNLRFHGTKVCQIIKGNKTKILWEFSTPLSHNKQSRK